MGMGTVCLCSGAILVYHGSNSEVYISKPAGIDNHSQTISHEESLRWRQQVWQLCDVYVWCLV